MSKEVNTSTREVNVYFFILNKLKEGLRPSLIAKELGVTKQALTRYLSSLKALGYIRKIGYGVWEVLKEEVNKQPDKSTRVTKVNPASWKPDSVRAHAFQFTFEIPKNFQNWEKRAELLKRAEIPFKELNLFGGGQQLVFKGRKIWLTNNSIIIFERSSYMADTAEEGRSYAINDAITLVRGLESHLSMNLGKYRFKVSRQHYSLIRNALAKQYNREGKKLAVYNENGLWLEIDNSFNLEETEMKHPITAPTDTSKVQNFFNGIKKYDNFTPEFVVNSLGKMSEGFNLYSENIASHIKAIQDLGHGVDELVKQVKELKK